MDCRSILFSPVFSRAFFRSSTFFIQNLRNKLSSTVNWYNIPEFLIMRLRDLFWKCCAANLIYPDFTISNTKLLTDRRNLSDQKPLYLPLHSSCITLCNSDGLLRKYAWDDFHFLWLPNVKVHSPLARITNQLWNDETQATYRQRRQTQERSTVIAVELSLTFLGSVPRNLRLSTSGQHLTLS